MTKGEAIERLKQNKAAAEYYAGVTQITAEIENALKDKEVFDMAIEALSADRPTGWIPCNEKMPEEMEWAGTERFGTTISEMVYVTFETPDGYRFTEHLRFQNGQLSGRTQKYIDAIGEGIRAIAWMPLPKPWKGENK